jgi:drug/metabolite transporter (DMT)-like permease
MPITACLLVVAAAITHTGWNYIIKSTEHRQAVIWLALIFGSLICLPFLIMSLPLPSGIWLYALMSVVIEVAYFTYLLRAYKREDFSLVYPVARGTAPILLTGWVFLLFKDFPGVAGLVGLAILITGLIMVGGSGWFDKCRATSMNTTGLGAALVTAFLISLYSVIDAAAVMNFSPSQYTVLIFSLIGLFITPFVLKRYGLTTLCSIWLARWKLITNVSVLMLLTYLMVIIAFTLSHVSYVGGLRELGIVFSLLLGRYKLGENFGPLRVVGALIVFAGVLIISIMG